MGECVIIFNKDLQREARFVRKQSAQLASKMRYLSCQFTTYLTDDLWLKNAAHANAMAGKLYRALKELPEVTFTQKPESNQLFSDHAPSDYRPDAGILFLLFLE